MKKLGINYYPGFNIPCDEWMSYIKALGFNSFFSSYGDISMGKALSISDFADYAAKYGLDYECVHAPFKRINHMWSANEDEGGAMLKMLTDCVEECGKSGVPMAVVHLSSGENSPHINDIGHARFDTLVECAVKNNVKIAFENQRKIANLAFVMELYKDVENVGFCWDVGHEKCFAHGKEFMPLFGDRLIYTHIHDNTSVFQKDYHMLPFDGNIDFSRVADRLKEYGKDVTLTLEVIPSQYPEFYDGVSFEDYYKKAYNAIVKLRSLIDKE